MPTIGWFEILIILFVAIIIIGPKDFPFMLKKIGSWFGTTKRYIAQIQSEVSDITTESIDDEQTETKKTIKKDE